MAMHKEVNLMSKMYVYELIPLLEGHWAIGCQWVLEFKEDLKGGLAFKAKLVTQGLCHVPCWTLNSKVHFSGSPDPRSGS
jgi:hypothetical protein